jgi:transposase-like protein
MSAAILQNPIFTDNDKAREWLEARVWANGRPCPHCGVVDNSSPLKGKAHRVGLYQCNSCREQFTVTVGTVFERSKIPLSKWLTALFLMVASKKGVSAHQVHRMLGISYKSTWFMMHRLREAMREGALSPMGAGCVKTPARFHTDLFCSLFRAPRSLGSEKIANNFAPRDCLQNFAEFSHGLGRFAPFATRSVYDRYLREADGWSRR